MSSSPRVDSITGKPIRQRLPRLSRTSTRSEDFFVSVCLALLACPPSCRCVSHQGYLHAVADSHNLLAL